MQGFGVKNFHELIPALQDGQASSKAQRKGKDNKADRGKGGKTTSGNGQAWSAPIPIGENGGNWL